MDQVKLYLKLDTFHYCNKTEDYVTSVILYICSNRMGKKSVHYFLNT